MAKYGLRIGLNLGDYVLNAKTGFYGIQGQGVVASTSNIPVVLAAGAGSYGISGQSVVMSVTTGGSGGPAAPGRLQILLMGQTAANQTTNAPTPAAPNSMTLGWDPAVAGAYPVSYYRLYRTAANGTTFSLYADNITAHQYTDNAAILCVNGTAGSAAPYYAANTYLYKVSAVDTHGNEGPQSGTQIFIMYQNGLWNWGLDYVFAGSVNYEDTTAGPLGGTADILATLQSYGGILPVSSKTVTQWNFPVGAFKYLNFSFKALTANSQFNMYALRVGDVGIYNSTGNTYNIDPTNSKYGAWPGNNVWATRKIPLADFLTDYGPKGVGPAVIQNSLYKFAIQLNIAGSANKFAMDNVIFTPT